MAILTPIEMSSLRVNEFWGCEKENDIFFDSKSFMVFEGKHKNLLFSHAKTQRRKGEKSLFSVLA